MNKYKWQALGLVVLAILLILGTVGAVVTPKKSDIESADQQTATVEAKNAKLRDEIANLTILQPQQSIQLSRLAQMQTEIPGAYNQQDFIDSLNSVAAGAQVTIQSVTFSEASLASLPTVTTSKLSIGIPVQVPVSITVQGSYDQMQTFIGQLQKMQRIAVPSSVSYSFGNNGPTDTESTMTIQATMWSMLTSSTASSTAMSSE